MNANRDFLEQDQFATSLCNAQSESSATNENLQSQSDECADEQFMVVIEPSVQRSLDEICEAEGEFFERTWYARHTLSKHITGFGPVTEAEEEARRIESKYPDITQPMNRFQYGVLCGRLSALRWVLGFDFGQGDMDT